MSLAEDEAVTKRQPKVRIARDQQRVLANDCMAGLGLAFTLSCI